MKVLGVLGGQYTTAQTVFKWAVESDVILAADSGFLRTLEAGFVPDIAVGDFDSVPPEIAGTALVSHYDSGQDDTDCAKLLRYAEGMGYERVTLICTEGDLMDHQLDAIHAAARSNLNVRFALNRGIGVVLKGQQSLSFEVSKGSRVSLLPITDCSNVSLIGAKWSFENQNMSPLGFTSISNEASQELIRVHIQSGVSYLFIECDSPIW